MVASTALPKGPKGHFFWGNLREFNQDGLNFVRDIRTYGELATFKFGPYLVYMVNSPELMHDMLVTNASKYYKPEVTKTIFKPIIGNGLFTSDGEFWRRQRKLVQPAFHAKRIGAYGETMVQYTADMLDKWQVGQQRAIDHDMTELTLRIVSKTLFDADITTEAQGIGDVMRQLAGIIEHQFRQLFPVPLWIPTSRNRQLKRVMGELDALIQRFINERRTSGVDKGDFLSLLLEARDEDNTHMTDKQVRDEAMTLFGAGHETTAATLTWVWYLLSQHPAIEAKFHAELDQVLGGRLPTVEDLSQLPYTEMIVKEALRVYPVAWALTRQPHEPVTLGGFAVSPTSVIFGNIYGLHHDPKLFPDPERFDPERFTPENEKNIPKSAYLPFGGGPRICIGNAFAMMEARLIMATVGQRYRLSIPVGTPVIPERLFTLKPKGGMPMHILQREAIRQPAL